MASPGRSHQTFGQPPTALEHAAIQTILADLPSESQYDTVLRMLRLNEGSIGKTRDVLLGPQGGSSRELGG